MLPHCPPSDCLATCVWHVSGPGCPPGTPCDCVGCPELPGYTLYPDQGPAAGSSTTLFSCPPEQCNLVYLAELCTKLQPAGCNAIDAAGNVLRLSDPAKPALAPLSNTSDCQGVYTATSGERARRE